MAGMVEGESLKFLCSIKAMSILVKFFQTNIFTTLEIKQRLATI
jgi:hypothetical protein